MTRRIKARYQYRGARERRQERTSTPEWAAHRALTRTARQLERALTQILRNFATAVAAFKRRMEAHRENRDQ